jgi:hybrid cluster-associated redox disulfide protein
MKVTKRTLIQEIIDNNPRAIEIMLRYGLHCVGCMAAAGETLEEGAKAHGMKDKEIERMVSEINSNL